MKKRNVDMLHGPLLPNIIAYAIPIMLTGIFKMLFNTADLAVMGQFAGSLSVAAVGATGPLNTLIVNLFIGLSAGAGVATAHAIGKNDEQTLERTVHTTMTVAFLGGIVLMLIAEIFCEPLLRMTDTPEDALPLAAVYMRIYFAATPATMVYDFGAAMLQAAGDTKRPMIIITSAGVVNAILNVLFVAVFRMDVAGVALSTAISHVLAGGGILLLFMRGDTKVRLNVRKLRIHKEPMLKILKIGLPVGLQMVITSVSNVIYQTAINSFGEAFMSGHIAARTLNGYSTTMLNAFYQVALNFVGQNVGAGQYKRIKKIISTSLACGVVIGLSVGTLVYIFGRPLLSIFVPDSPEAIRYGMVNLAILGLPCFLLAITNVASGALRGLGESLVTMVISLAFGCGFMVLWIWTVFQLPQFHTPAGLYISTPINWAMQAVILFAAFAVIYRKRVRQTQESLNA